MTEKNATDAGNPIGGQTIKEVSVTFKGATDHRRADVSLVQNVLLIWLDDNIDEDSSDYRNTITQLRHVVNAVNTFTNRDQCIDFLTDIYTEKVFMLISGELGEDIVPLVHDATQLDSIYIFGENKTKHEKWTKEWPKIIGVFTEISPICNALKEAAQQCEHNATSISFMSTNGEALSNKNLDQLNCSFMYTQILKEILLTMQFEQQHINEFANHCREVFAVNDGEINNVKKLEHKYRDETPIWWYTCACFLYPTLNRALRAMDVNIIIKMGFFISDLHRHIERLHSEQFGAHPKSQVLIVYRGQGLSTNDFDQLLKTKGGLMSFNSFLSTSNDREVSFAFAESNQINTDLFGILFVMTIDPSESTTPFASTNEISHFTAEDEILFSMHSVFRIGEIKSIGENNRLWQVVLTLTSDNDEDLRVLTERLREEIDDSIWWNRLGHLLLKMGQPEKAQQLYEIVLQPTSDDMEKAVVYHQIGWIKSIQGEYCEAITFFEQSLEIYQKTLSSTHPALASSYNNIGNVYHNMGEYSKALSHYEKALEIDQKTLLPTHPDLAMSYNNIGNLYYNIGEYSKALSYNEKALEIRLKTLPQTHPDLADSYNNIGSVYDRMGEYSKALSYYEKAFEIQRKTLPPSHPDLAMSYKNMGNVFKNKGNYLKALSCHVTPFEIRQKTLSPNHPDLADSYIGIGVVYRNMGEYSKAISHYEKALEIRLKTLPPTHPDLIKTYVGIGLVYYKKGEYSKSLLYYEKALQTQQKTLPPTHPDLVISYSSIGFAYEKMGEYSKALSFRVRTVEIQQKTLPSNYPDLAEFYNNMGNVFKNRGNYSKALSCHKKAFEIRQITLPPNHPNLVGSYKNIGEVYRNMGEYSKALSFLENALEIIEKTLPSNHRDFAEVYNHIGQVFRNMGAYSKALSFYGRAIDIGQRSLPSNHLDLQKWRNNLELVKNLL